MFTAFFRAASAGVFLILIAFILKRPLPRARSEWAYICAVGFTATSIGFWGMFYAGSLLSPGLATVITNTQPIIAGILGWFFLQERMGKMSFLGILLAFLGIAIISLDSLLVWERQFITGVFYILAAAAGVATSNILLKKINNRIDTLYAMGFQLLIGSIPLGILASSRDNISTVIWQWEYVLSLFSLSIFGTAAPFVIWYWLMSKAPLYQLNVFSFLTPIFGLAFGFVFFNEILNIRQWAGVSLVILAITLVSFVNNSTKAA
tara:strand:- start:6321 stop:7109 length:789 start_codon:yes stop_codon:yes gene_type:complete